MDATCYLDLTSGESQFDLDCSEPEALLIRDALRVWGSKSALKLAAEIDQARQDVAPITLEIEDPL